MRYEKIRQKTNFYKNWSFFIIGMIIQNVRLRIYLDSNNLKYKQKYKNYVPIWLINKTIYNILKKNY